MIACVRKIRVLIFVLSVLLSSHIYAVGLYDASYENNLLKIPLIKVGDVVYEVTMIREESAELARIGCTDYCFRLASAEVARNYSSSIYALYEASTSTATFNNLLFDNRVYKVTLKHAGQLNGGDYFSVVNADYKPILSTISGPLGQYWEFEDTGLIIPNTNASSSRVLTKTGMADVNGDGIQDLLIESSDMKVPANSPLQAEDFLAANALVLLGGEQLRSGEALFQGDVLMHTIGTKVLTYDFNGDGRMDIFFAASGPDVANPNGTQSKVAISSGSQYVAAPMQSQVSFLHSAAVGRAAGLPVIYAGALWGENKIPFLYVYNNGAFSVDRTMLPSLVTASTTDPWAPTVEKPLRAFTASKIGDVTGDGIDDLILGIESLPSHATSAGPAVGNYLVTGTEQGWANGQVIKLPDPSFIAIQDVLVLDIEIADLFNSGRNDIILNYTYKYESRGIQILRNLGNSVFEDVTTDMLGTSAYLNQWPESEIRVIDINGDNCLDIVLPFFKGKANSKLFGEVFLNDCKGAFVDATSVFSAAMSDLNARRPNGGIIHAGGLFLIPIVDYTGRTSFYMPLLDDYISNGANSLHFFKLNNLKNMPTPVNGELVY